MADILADLKRFHLISREWTKQVYRRLVGLLTIEPAVELAFTQDHWYSVMDWHCPSLWLAPPARSSSD